jgi:hypothetical protein
MTIHPLPVVLWLKIRGHPAIREDLAHQSLGYIPPYSETGWAYHVIIDHVGRTWAVQVWRCTVLPYTAEYPRHDCSRWNRPLTEIERLYEWAKKPDKPNPDLSTDF